jgi:hypothetical protein
MFSPPFAVREGGVEFPLLLLLQFEKADLPKSERICKNFFYKSKAHPEKFYPGHA